MSADIMILHSDEINTSIETPASIGWYVVSIGYDGFNPEEMDGPYATKEEATAAMLAGVWI